MGFAGGATVSSTVKGATAKPAVIHTGRETERQNLLGPARTGSWRGVQKGRKREKGRRTKLHEGQEGTGLEAN